MSGGDGIKHEGLQDSKGCVQGMTSSDPCSPCLKLTLLWS